MPTLPACTAVISVLSVERSMSPGVTFEGEGDEAGNGVSHVDDQGAPPERRCGGHQAEHEAGDHLAPARRAERPRCSEMMKLRPIQPRMTTRAAEVMAQTTIHAWLHQVVSRR